MTMWNLWSAFSIMITVTITFFLKYLFKSWQQHVHHYFPPLFPLFTALFALSSSKNNLLNQYHCHPHLPCLRFHLTRRIQVLLSFRFCTSTICTTFMSIAWFSDINICVHVMHCLSWRFNFYKSTISRLIGSVQHYDNGNDNAIFFEIFI